MTDPVRAMAERARRESCFFGFLLEQFARAESLDDAALAAQLGCDTAQLVDLRLCGAPRPETLVTDVREVAEGLQLDAGRLLAVVKRARVLAQMQDTTETTSLLMAAREREE